MVTPCLNAALFIRETLDSVAAQGDGVEHIVVDGGSSDGTLDILRRDGGSVRLVVEPGLRQAAAVNHGWRLAAGEVLGWLNADDVYLPGAVDRAVSYFALHPEVDGMYGDCDYVDAAGAFLRRYPAAEFDVRRMLGTVDNPVPQPAAFLRRTSFEKFGGLDESLDYAMDLEYWLRLGASGGRLGYLPTPLARLRLHDAAKSLRGLDHFGEELLRVYEGLFRRSDLPADLRRLRCRALSAVEKRAAQCLFWAGHYREARRHAWQAWCGEPWRVNILLLALGAPARYLRERLAGNPFRLGMDRR